MSSSNQFLEAFSSSGFTWIGPFTRTMVATFVGAGLAFFLQNVREKRQERKEQIRTFNQAIVTIAQMHNELANYNKQAILPFLDRPIPFMDMYPVVLGDLAHLRLHADKFAFMGASSNGKVPFRVGNTDLLFIRAVSSIAERVSYYLNSFQPSLESKFSLTDTPTIEEFEQKIGAAIVLRLESHTNMMIGDVEDALYDLEKLIELLKTTGISRYGKGKIITYTPGYNEDLPLNTPGETQV